MPKGDYDVIPLADPVNPDKPAVMILVPTKPLSQHVMERDAEQVIQETGNYACLVEGEVPLPLEARKDLEPMRELYREGGVRIKQDRNDLILEGRVIVVAENTNRLLELGLELE
ncbi:MAG: hypothetical protein DRO11_02015 [Methanobacteriota archaeon]|nr:MAG: hypothetical protein DRO11_02015 [Euryarchaeota archaeon]